MSNDRYTVGWICASMSEYLAAQAFLDKRHGPPETLSPNGNIKYTLGEIRGHYVVIAVPDEEVWTASAAEAAMDLVRSFPNVRLGLMVGVGGSAPTVQDVRLGDIVVGTSCNGRGGFCHFDRGQAPHPMGFLIEPPPILRTAVAELQAQYKEKGHQLKNKIERVLEHYKRLKRRYARPPVESDRLYESQFTHNPNSQASCAELCDDSKLIIRPKRIEEDNPVIHYGLIASGNLVMKDAVARDELAIENGILCFDTEAAGLMDNFPCLVIRGICDYSDSHTNNYWQGYAAMVAAAYASDLLCQISPQQVEQEQSMSQRNGHEAINPLSRNASFEELPFVRGAEFDSYTDQHGGECLPGTRTELLEQIEEWAFSSQGRCIFYLIGTPGTGKSTISRTIARTLSRAKALGASFFFRLGDADRGNARKLIPTVARQLAINVPQFFPALRKATRDNPDIASKPLWEQVDKLLFEPLHGLTGTNQKHQTVVIVIDALDECESDEDVRTIIRLLPLLQKIRVACFRVFLTSRPKFSVRFAFQDLAKDHYQELALHEMPKTVTEDIFLCLSAHFAKVRTERGISQDWPGDNVIQSLSEFSAPSFTCAYSVCKILDDPQLDPLDSLQEILLQLSENSKQERSYITLGDGDWVPEGDNNPRCDASDIESIFSIESFLSSQSSQDETTSIAISELTNMLLRDDDLKLLYPIAISKVGPDKFQKKFAHSLQKYGKRLIAEASNEIQSQAARFVRKSARRTAAQICRELVETRSEISRGEKPKLDISKSAQVNAWINSQTEGRQYSIVDDIEVSMDYDLSDLEDDHQSSLTTLEEVKEFITKEFPALRQEFQEWLETRGKDHRESRNEKVIGLFASYKNDDISAPNVTKDYRLDHTSEPEPLEGHPVNFPHPARTGNRFMEEFAAESTSPGDVTRLPSWWIRFMNIFAPPAAGYQRIQFICGCGEPSYVDVKELSAGGIEKFRRRLFDNVAAVHTGSYMPSTSGHVEPPPRVHLNSSVSSSFHQHSVNLGAPYHHFSQPIQAGDTPDCSITSQNQEPQFVLLCMNTKSSTVLVHVEVSTLANDQYFFEQIFREYQNHRREHGFKVPMFLPLWACNLLRAVSVRLPVVPSVSKILKFFSRLSPIFPEKHLFRIQSADFVRFSLIPIGMRCCPSWFKAREFPPEDEVRKRRYLYEPVPMEDVELFHIPLRHLLKPGPHTDRFWMATIPKKLRDPLVRLPGNNQHVIGWGIRVNESLNWVLVLSLILVILLAVGVSVIICAVLTSDNSSAFGLGAFLVAMFTTYLTYQYHAWKDDI